jgi:2-succinyl-5-enolpyruvyl-6-hydroxy-3-cyclohexene-1-carboxylate synthase
VPRPVAVATTSGTAVANLHPAVLEATHSGVPLLVVSADRPHELRGTGANQTTDQVGIFGGAVRAALDLPAGVDPATVRGHVTRLVAAALGTLSRDPGPAHVNVGFREPLTPADRWEPGAPPSPVHLAPTPTGEPVAVPPGRRTLVVAGDGAGPVAARVADAAHWPLLAEPTSGARTGAAITHYQSLLAGGLADDVERVVVFGHPTLSRPVSALLARPGVVVVGGPRWTDVAGAAEAVVPGVAPPEPTTVEFEWLARWRAADAEAEESWRGTPIERAARAVWEQDEVLVLGSSMTIRAFDRATVPREVRAVANRGLAGIDGTVSTAAGLAAGLGRPVRVVLGDLAFLHDAGGLAVGDLEREADLQVVVLDDHGGGIFAGLEYGAEADTDLLARYFTTPQHVDPSGIARAFGAGYARVAVEDLPTALAEPIRGRSILHVPLSQ